MQQVQRRWFDSLLAWYFVIVWGSGFVATKVGLQYAAPFTFLTLRYAFGLACLIPLVLALRPRWPTSRAEFGHVLAAGLLMHAAHLGGSLAGQDARLGGMGVHHVGPQVRQQAAKLSRGGTVAAQVDLPPQRIDHGHAVAAAQGAAHQFPFRPQGRPGHQRHLVPARVQALAGQQRVLLRPAEDHSRNHVAYPHPHTFAALAARVKDRGTGRP